MLRIADRVTGLARPSVRPSVRLSVVGPEWAPNWKAKRRTKTIIGVNVRWSGNNSCVVYSPSGNN